MENNKNSKNLAQQIALQVLKDYEQKHKDGIVKIISLCYLPYNYIITISS